MTSLHCVDELIKMGHKLNLFPIGQPQCHPRHADNIRQALKNSDKFDTAAPCIRLWHQHDMSMFVGRGNHIGFPIFELDTFTEKEQHHLESCDGLFVCSQWAKHIIACNCHYITHHCTDVVPLGVDTTIFTPKKSTRKPTIFLNVGKWEVRKGHDLLVHAFNQAFTPTDNVELWMMNDNPFLSPAETDAWQQRYKQSKLCHKIRFLPRVELDIQVAEIMQQTDCGVFPSRAEGWNLEALEMMACGKEVIITDYSAHTEFCTQENSMLVPIIDTEPAFDGKWFFNQGNWAKMGEYEVGVIVTHMQQVHRAKQNNHLGPNEAGIATANKFTWQNTANVIISSIK
jgi:glycosyltransferase involved in cell wall biosynthesis